MKRPLAHRRSARRPATAGMTLIEIMIVMAVIAGVSALGIAMVRRVTEADLREQSAQVVAVLQSAYNMSAQTGMHHRVLFDLEKQTLQIEACDEEIKLRKSDEEQVLDEEALAKLLERKPTSDQVPEVLKAASPEAALSQAAALEGTRVGTARCQVPKKPNGDADGRGNVRRIATGLGVKIQRIHVQHLKDPVNDGLVSINFFPLGYAEKAVIEVVSDDGDRYILLVHRLTGRIELKKGDYDPDDHMRRDAAGDDVEDER